jgi:hypothetical protein
MILEKIKYEEFIKEIKTAPLAKPKNTRHRYLIHNLAILKEDDKEFVIPKKEENEPNPRIFLYKEEMFDKLYDEHCPQGHRGRDLMNKHCATRYANVTIEIINLILKFCMECTKKNRKNTISSVVVKPIRSSDFLNRVQIDPIDCQSYPDGPYKFILNVQDHF